MNKVYTIGNAIYLPIMDSNKYMSGSISGQLFPNDILTLEEIKEKAKRVDMELFECKDLHSLCAAWGNKETSFVNINQPIVSSK